MRVLLLCLLLGAPAQAQTRIGADGNVTLDVAAVAEETLRLFSDGGADASFRYLDATIRDARGRGWLTADAGLLFAMYADALRNIRANPGDALRIADEGLGLSRSGTPKDPREVLMLEVARAYALADLGRFDGAVAAATLALPMLRAAFSDGTADDLAGYVAEWQAGRMSILNESALDLARKAIGRAETAVDASDQTTVLAEASRAILPPEAAFDPGQVALVNAEARALAGRTLNLLRRGPEARAMLAEGVAGLYGADWARHAAAQPAVQVPEASRDRITQLFYWLARSGIDSGDRALAVAALLPAERYGAGTEWQGIILLVRMQLAVMDGDVAAVDALTGQAAAAARAAGDEDFARLAEFYRATSHASMVPGWDEVDVRDLVQTARAAMAHAVPGSAIDGGFVRGQLASLLIQTGSEALAHASRMRSLAELHLFAAHALDSRRPGATCFDAASGRGCVIVVNPRK